MGPPNDFIDVECVIKFSHEPTRAYGFKLRNDIHATAHEGMLDLLRDAYKHNWPVAINYLIEPGKNNGIIIRVWLQK